LKIVNNLPKMNSYHLQAFKKNKKETYFYFRTYMFIGLFQYNLICCITYVPSNA
jgi:hypothetical protein